jgi:hypothetical protein
MSTSNYYAGIGSRSTPTEIQTLMTEIARKLAAIGYILRSGHADGADLAFEKGAAPNADIYLPSPGFNSHHPITSQTYHQPTQAAIELAQEYHPAWARCGNYARRLHARNMHQILGLNLDTPVRFVICWTPDGQASGGTGQAIRLATALSIPVFNLANREDHERLARFCAPA